MFWISKVNELKKKSYTKPTSIYGLQPNHAINSKNNPLVIVDVVDDGDDGSDISHVMMVSQKS